MEGTDSRTELRSNAIAASPAAAAAAGSLNGLAAAPQGGAAPTRNHNLNLNPTLLLGVANTLGRFRVRVRARLRLRLRGGYPRHRWAWQGGGTTLCYHSLLAP